jgi:cytochrome c-type biogenesis protein
LSEITTLMVFAAGIASFVSPCFLPLLPIYIGFLSGKALGNESKANVIRNSLGFIIGFTIIFVLLGATASFIGQFLVEYKNLLAKVLGITIIFMGLFYMELIPIKALFAEKRFIYKGRKDNFLGAIVLGIALAFGWTPCIGPILASVLSVAASKNSYIYGMYLLFVYSMGIAIPFLITATLIQGAVNANKFRRLLKYTKLIKRITGIIMIIAGILVYTNYFAKLSALLS